jgi:ketosteroid isomerase-like protein
MGLIGTQAVNAQSETRAADERAIREAELEWWGVTIAKNLERTVAFYADDASMFPPNAPIATGKEAIRAVWSQLLTTPGVAISGQTTKVEASRGGDLGYSIGTYELITPDPAGKPVTDHGKYVVVWKKQADGSWKVMVDIFNSNLPAPAAAAR